jgi:hypothetical protein
MTCDATIRLFSYGTLQSPQVQQATFGRLLEGEADALPGYRQSLVEITDAEVLATSGERFHPIVTKSGEAGDQVAGTAFLITAAELAAADAYEVDAYRREAVRLASGREAFVYVKA